MRASRSGRPISSSPRSRSSRSTASRCSRSATSSTRDIPFFFLSQRATTVISIDRLRAGRRRLLAKPVALDVLTVKVKRLVAERARARDAAPGRHVNGSLAESSPM